MEGGNPHDHDHEFIHIQKKETDLEKFNKHIIKYVNYLIKVSKAEKAMNLFN